MADIAVSFADVPAAQRPSEIGLYAERSRRLRDDRPGSLPFELDLADPASHATLRAIDISWPRIPAEQKSHWLQNLRVTLPVRQIATGDIALLPGGIIAARHPKACLVCEPLDAITLQDSEARQVRHALLGCIGVATLLHTDEGVMLRSLLPELLPPQSASIVFDASSLPGRASCAGPAVIQWFASGATIWPLVPAPPSLSLAASVAGVTLSEDAPPLTAEFWDARDADTRLHLLSASLADYLSELLPVELSDDLRFALMELCVSGSDSLARRLADVLAAIPACFLGDPKDCPGEPPVSWSTGIGLLRRSRRPLAMLGIEPCSEPRRVVNALREAVIDDTAVIFHETRDGQRGVTAALDSDAALFVARWAGEGGRVGVLLEPPLSPVGLYTLATELAREVGGTVVAAAPCWGFCHRVTAHGREAGNASWFGMGVGLDELDLLISDVADGR